jgi:hypothetical protein
MKQKTIKPGRIIIRKKYTISEMLEFIKKHSKPDPKLNVANWMAKNGR